MAMSSLSAEKRKQSHVRFAESDTGDLTLCQSDGSPKFAPLPALTIAISEPSSANKDNTQFSPSRKALNSPVRKPSPTVHLDVATDRDYLPLLHQTKMVYDQLLCDKQDKLLHQVYKVKHEYDRHCRTLDSNPATRERALEYAVRAQAHLNELQQHAEIDLEALHKDYQMKMDKMILSLDEQWRRENPHKTVQYKVYPHK